MKNYYYELKSRLDAEPKYRDNLFRRAFAITDNKSIDLESYPFYGTWKSHPFGSYNLLIHPSENAYFHSYNGRNIVLIGYAFDPYSDVIDENIITKKALELYLSDRDAFFDYLDELTGVFVFFIENDGDVFAVQDCSGPIAVFFGKIDKYNVFASSPQLVGDIFDLPRYKNAERLIDSKGYKRGSGFLPGNITPYKELKRLGCNTYLEYSDNLFSISRFFPRKKCEPISDEGEKKAVIKDMAALMTKSIDLAMKKWPKLSLSLTGGVDSGTEFACASKYYDDIYVFSFASKDSEKIDADAAAQICKYMGVNHHMNYVPENPDDIEDYDFLDKIIEHNNSYMCKIHPNEKRKFIFFDGKDELGAEFKGDVSEIARAFCDRKYYKVKYPRVLDPRHFTISQGRYFFEPWAEKFCDTAFKHYMEETGLTDDILGYSMQDLCYWEIKTGSWAANVYNMQCYMHPIVMIYNNRNLMKMFLRFSKEERANDLPHKWIVEEVNPKLSKFELRIKDSYFGITRMLIETAYYYFATRLNTKGHN